MNLFKKIVIYLFIAFIAIQFIQFGSNKSDQLQGTDIKHFFRVPQNVQTILDKSCYDCHSNNTRYPWYANIQPMGWLLSKHIREGKADLNFSEFKYSKRMTLSKLTAIASTVKDGSMPLPAYTLLHRDAKLSESDKNILASWITTTKDSLENK